MTGMHFQDRLLKEKQKVLLGFFEGEVLGEQVGNFVGSSVLGLKVGDLEGKIVGLLTVGKSVGIVVGVELEGEKDGPVVGTFVEGEKFCTSLTKLQLLKIKWGIILVRYLSFNDFI